MNEMKIFENPDFGQVRIIIIDKEPWFVGKDIAEKLGYKDTVNALKRHVDADDKGGCQIATPSGEQFMVIINESGLYSLVLSSKLPAAREFKRWITSVVIPAIRRNGGYIVGADSMTDAEIMAQAVLVAERTIKEKNLQIADLNGQIGKLRPAADYAHSCLRAENGISVTSIAKEIGMTAQMLNGILNAIGVQYKKGEQWFLYSKFDGKGYTVTGTYPIIHNDGHIEVRVETLWTQRGKAFLLKQLTDSGFRTPISKRSQENSPAEAEKEYPTAEEFKQRVREQCKQYNLSLAYIARQAGIHPSTLAGGLNGKRTLTNDTIKKVWDALRERIKSINEENKDS